MTMKGVQKVDLGTLLQVTQALEAVVGPCFGPSGGQVLFTRDTGEVLITRDGQRILTSLRLDHPVARVLVGSVLAHFNITGDGAKSFLLLLGALLRGIHGDRLHGAQARRILLSFQSLVLDDAIGQGLAPHAPPLLRDSAHLRSLSDAYFRGKTGSSHWGVLSETACELYRRWRCGAGHAGVALISRHFAALHTTVPGMPVSRTRILEGLVIHRDFAVSCHGDGPLRALAASAPLQRPLAATGTTLSLASEAQLQRCLDGAGRRAELGVACLRRLGVGLLLSAVKQSELALDHARRAGLSVVQCVYADELALFCELTGAELFSEPGGWSLVGEEHVATVTFCRPAVLGPDRAVHVGLQEGRGLAPHCLVVCGPTPGVAEQCAAAFHGLFRMLQRALEPVQSHHPPGPVQSCDTQGKDEDAENTGQYMVKQPSMLHDTRLVRAPTNIRDIAHLSTESTEAGGPQDGGEGPLALICDPSCGEGTQAPIRDPSKEVGPLCADQNPYPACTEPRAEPTHQTLDRLQNAKASGEQPNVHFGEGKEGALGLDGRETGPASSGVLIEAGSVLPAGGAFEFLLHRYLLQRASRCLCPDLGAACRLVAGAVLAVPRRLYPGRHFLRAQSHFLGPPGATDPLGGRDWGLESLACKYQLLLSVLQTATCLLSVDLILHIRVPSHTEQSQEEEEEEEEGERS